MKPHLDDKPVSPPLIERSPSFAGMRVLVVGLGRFGGGVGVTRFLAAQGASVAVTDMAPADKLGESLAALGDLDIRFRLGAHDPTDLDDADLVVVNPAIQKRRNPFFQEIEARGIPWTTEINLFCARCPATVLGVTGSFGKSTTAAMLAEAVRTGWKGSVYLGGNIGVSLLGEVDRMSHGDLVVLELSNAQLEDLPRIRWAPPVSVITNLVAHHPERYDSPAAYFDAKLNIARDPTRESRIVVGAMASATHELLLKAIDSDQARLFPSADLHESINLTLPGRHNRANAALALRAAELVGIDHDQALTAIAAFPGLPDRLERVAEIDGRRYINDSKSTAPAAVVTALSSLDGPIVLILGGQMTDAPLDRAAEEIVRRCRDVVCTGESARRWAKAIRACPNSARVDPVVTGTLHEALEAARKLARSGDTILFSPGAPSFDQYTNYARRGAHFRDLVRGLSAT